jgi:hypothetical protein
MTAGQSTRRYPNVSLAPAPVATLLAVALIIGVMLGAAITLQLGSSGSNANLAGAAAQPAATFDAIKFRAEERAPLQVPFDAVKFRAEERAPLVAKPDSGASGSNLTDDLRGK